MLIFIMRRLRDDLDPDLHHHPASTGGGIVA